MPTYDYFCDCGAVKLDEIVKHFKEVVKCEECGQEMARGLAAPNLGGFDKQGSSKSVKKP